MTSPGERAIYIHRDVIRGHHLYKAVWTPTIGERLCVQREPRNALDRRAVAVLTSEDTLVGHVPREISKIFWHFKNRCLLLPEKSRAGWVLKSV